MIIIGYQGIGKSSVANKHIEFIDLESGNFWNNGIRPNDWYIYYTNIANHLSKQGKNVFTSSHEVVRNALKDSKERVIVAYPSLDLKDKWLKRLEDRYNNTQLEKDYKALMNAKDRYEENIKELINSGFETLEINDINYDLYDYIQKNLKK